jgi:hypothetical protein
VANVSVEGVSALTVNVFDTAELTDSPTVDVQAVPILTIDVSDSAVVSDVPTLFIGAFPPLSISVYDSAVVSDTTTVEAALEISLYDDAIVKDDYYVIEFESFVSVYDSAVVSDIITVETALEISVYDDVITTEDVTTVTVLNVSVYDSVDVQDIPFVATGALDVVVYDDAVVTDVAVAAIPTLYIDLFDSVSVTDSINIGAPYGVFYEELEIVSTVTKTEEFVSSIDNILTIKSPVRPMGIDVLRDSGGNILYDVNGVMLSTDNSATEIVDTSIIYTTLEFESKVAKDVSFISKIRDI